MEKNTRGITLIALIITIIVMLILVAVAIRLTTEGKLFIHTGNATKQTRNEVGNEQRILNTIGDDVTGEDLLIQSTGGWYEKSDGVFTNGKFTVTLGDYINYECYNDQIEQSKLTYTSTEQKNGSSTVAFTVTEDSNNKKWKVIGTENGKLVIAMEEPVTTDEGNEFTLYGAVGLENAVNELNEISKIYGYGENADSARSIKVEDINKIGKYNPSKDPNYNGNNYGSGNIDEYGNSVTYTKDGNYLRSTGTNEATKSFGGTYTRNDSGSHPGSGGSAGFGTGKTTYSYTELGLYKPADSTETDPLTIQNNYYIYTYYIYNYYDPQNINNLKYLTTKCNSHYYLASLCTWTTVYPCWGVRVVSSEGLVSMDSLWRGLTYTYTVSRSLVPTTTTRYESPLTTNATVRPVVILKSDINLVADEIEENTWNFAPIGE